MVAGRLAAPDAAASSAKAGEEGLQRRDRWAPDADFGHIWSDRSAQITAPWRIRNRRNAGGPARDLQPDGLSDTSSPMTAQHRLVRPKTGRQRSGSSFQWRLFWQTAPWSAAIMQYQHRRIADVFPGTEPVSEGAQSASSRRTKATSSSRSICRKLKNMPARCGTVPHGGRNLFDSGTPAALMRSSPFHPCISRVAAPAHAENPPARRTACPTGRRPARAIRSASGVPAARRATPAPVSANRASAPSRAAASRRSASLLPAGGPPPQSTNGAALRKLMFRCMRYAEGHRRP